MRHQCVYSFESCIRSTTDARFKRVHTLMPHFISTEYMEDKDNGTDALFDFHQLVDHDYSKSGAHLRATTPLEVVVIIILAMQILILNTIPRPRYCVQY